MNGRQEDAHDLMPDAIVSILPALYSTEKEEAPEARLKWFTPDSSWTWYIQEYDPKDRLCFGLVIGHEREFGYFSLDEILSIRGPLGLQVERDLHFKPMPIKDCQ